MLAGSKFITVIIGAFLPLTQGCYRGPWGLKKGEKNLWGGCLSLWTMQFTILTPIFQTILSLEVHSSIPVDTRHISEAGNPSVSDIASPDVPCSHSPPEVVPCVELPEVLVIPS